MLVLCKNRDDSGCIVFCGFSMTILRPKLYKLGLRSFTLLCLKLGVLGTVAVLMKYDTKFERFSHNMVTDIRIFLEGLLQHERFNGISHNHNNVSAMNYDTFGASTATNRSSTI